MTVAALMLVIAVSAPWMHKPQQRTYAKAILHTAHRYHLPPLLFAAVIENESHWHHSVVGGSKTSPSIGLGQIALRNYRACRKDLKSNGCKAIAARLSNGSANIAAMGAAFNANRKLCGRRLSHYLAGYQGARCKPVDVTRRVLRRMRQMRRIR